MENNKSPYFTIIIPTKDRTNLLEQCIISIQNQSFTDFEILVIDDHSLQKPAINYNNSYLFPNQGKGRSAARNTGLHYANGKYICFVDDDDIVGPNYLQDFYNFYTQNINCEEKILRCRFNYMDSHGKSYKYDTPFEKSKHINGIKYITYNMCAMTTVSIPSALAKKHQFSEQHYLWEDTHYLLRVFEEAYKNDADFLVQLSGKNYYYRQHEDMTSQQYSIENLEKMCEDNVSAIKDYFDNYRTQDLNKKDKEFLLSQKYLEYAILALKVKNKGLAKSLILKSFYNKKSIKFWKEYLIYIKNSIFNH